MLLIQTHVLFVHEMWDADAGASTQQDSITPKASWGWDAIKREVLSTFALFTLLGLTSLLLAHPDVRGVNYSFFEQWAEAEVEDINFYIVAPHWYFRAHMGLLTVCAQHYEGLAWLVGFYVLLCAMPQLHRLWNAPRNGQTAAPSLRSSPLAEAFFATFVASLVFVGGTLPCGRFYYEAHDGLFGQSLLRVAYEYLYLYLGALAHLGDRVTRWYTAAPARRSAL